MSNEEESAEENGNRRRFAEAAREQRPDLALLCLLIGAEAAAVPPVGPVHRPGRPEQPEPSEQPEGPVQPEGPGRPGGESAEESGGRKAPQDGPHGTNGMLDAEIELDRLAGLLPYSPTRTPEQWAEALRRLLGEELGFGGEADDYRRLESSLLQTVLRRRRGLPILLSVVWIEVARRAGAPVYGVGLPGHFVVGFGDPSGQHVLADPYGSGRELSSGDVEELIAGATGARTRVPAAVLRPAGPLEIVLRILNNIRAWAAARPEQSAVQLWALELSLLLPHHPAHLRHEHARLLVERGDFLTGAAELDDYAAVVEPVEPSAAETVRSEARAARARLN